MIKVLFLIHDLGVGGAEKVLVNLVNNMDKENYDITVMALFGGGVNEQFLKPHIHYRAIFKHCIRGNSKIMQLFSPKCLHDMFIKEHYDIEISYLEGPSARVISGCTDKNTKLISWIHVEQHTNKIAARAFRSYKEALSCYQKFDKTVCVSESVKEDFLKIFPNIENTGVLYNTNESDKILNLKDEAVEDESFKKDGIRLCGVGKLMPIKGFDKVARIHKRLIDEGYNVFTYILGVGADKEKIEHYIQESGISNTFHLLGYQTNPYKYVAKCDMFVCASTAEGFSTAATEALIVGTPVVTTPVAGMREMLGENNEYGIIADFSEESLYEAIKRIIEEPELLEHYKKQAVVRGKDFSREKTVRAVEKMLLSDVE